MDKINNVVSCVNDATAVVSNCVRSTVLNREQGYKRVLSVLVVKNH